MCYVLFLFVAPDLNSLLQTLLKGKNHEKQGLFIYFLSLAWLF